MGHLLHCFFSTWRDVFKLTPYQFIDIFLIGSLQLHILLHCVDALFIPSLFHCQHLVCFWYFTIISVATINNLVHMYNCIVVYIS